MSLNPPGVHGEASWYSSTVERFPTPEEEAAGSNPVTRARASDRPAIPVPERGSARRSEELENSNTSVRIPAATHPLY